MTLRQESSFISTPAKRFVPRLSDLPVEPLLDDIELTIDESAEYAVVVSMYEVYNDRIFDLLVPSGSAKAATKRRALLYKNTELSPDRKVVAGLRKVVCSSLDDALLVLEAGLHERKVAGTGSNATSSRSHGFFNVEVKKRRRTQIPGAWHSSSLTIMDLAGKHILRLNTVSGANSQCQAPNELVLLGQQVKLLPKQERSTHL